MSSKPDKEAILDSEHWKFVEEVNLTSIHTKKFPEAYRQQALRAMESYSASQNEELIKENENLKQDAAKMYSSLMDKNFQLQKENEELKSRFEKSFNLADIRRKEIDKLIIEQGQLQSTIDEKNKELERLKGLIESDFRPHWLNNEYDDLIHSGHKAHISAELAEAKWQQFKTENNL